MARTSLPPGFRFHPTDVELIMYYLLRKVTGKKLHLEAISELNLYQFSPWDLPDKSCLKAKDLEWYFFCPRERKYASGARMNRATETGYWKTTGKDKTISYNDRVVGMVKTLVFHEGNAPRGKRTDWVLHEYRLEDKRLADAGVVQDTFVLCKVFQKSGPGPRNGAQYGAPFKEEEWDDDDFDTSTLPSDAMSPLVHTLPEAQNCSVATSMAAPGSDCRPLLVEPAESKIQSSSNNGLPNAQIYSVSMNMVDPGSASGWSFTDDDFDTSTLPSDAMSPLVHTLPEAQNCSVATSMAAPGSGCRPLLVEPAESKIQSSSNNGLPNAQNYSVAMNMVDPGSASGWSLTDVAPGNISPYVNDQSTDEADDIARLLSAFSEEDVLLPFENCNIQLGDLNGGGNNEAAPHLAGSGSFDGLQDVCNLSCIVDAPASQYCLNHSNLLRHNDMPFLELDDLGASLAFSGPEPSSGGLYEAFTPFGPEQSVFPGLSNSDSTCNQIGQSFCNGPFFGPQPNFPVLSELPMLSNSSDGLLDSLVFPQTAMGYGNNLPQGGGSTNHFYPTSDSQPGNVRGAGGIQDRGSSHGF